MGKRALSALVVLALCLGMLPGAARAADLPASFYLSIGGTRVTADSNLADLLGDGTVSVSYEEVDGQKTWTINLNNANLTDSINATDASLNIVLTGENTITTTQLNHDGITTSWGEITITGGGSLTIDTENTGTDYPASAISVSSMSSAPDTTTGNITIQGIRDLTLKGNANAIGTGGKLTITDSTVTASNVYAGYSNSVIGTSRGIDVTRSHLKVTGADTNDGLSASATAASIKLTDSEVDIDVSGVAVYTLGDIVISNSTVTAESSSDTCIAADYRYGGDITISDGSVVEATGGGTYIILTPGDLNISASEVTASSEQMIPLYAAGEINVTEVSKVTTSTGGNYYAVYAADAITVSASEFNASSEISYAVFAGYDFSIINGSTANITTEGESLAVYVVEILTVSDSELNASSGGYGIYAEHEMNVGGESIVNAEGDWSAMYIIGGLTVDGGTVSAISSNGTGMESFVQLIIDDGEFHAKGADGYPAVKISTATYDDPLDWGPDPRIELGEGLAEISGGKIAMSDWYEVSSSDGPFHEYITTFIAADDETEVDYTAENALSEVTIRAVPADYTNVDAALAKVPADLSKYTEESVAALQAAIDAVVRNLTIRDQDTVDGFAQAIEEAIANLVVAVTGVTLNRDTLTLQMDGTAQLTATVAPEDAGDKTVAWTTGDPAVAVVDENGLVTAKGEGETVITVTTTDGGYEDSCTVTVEEEAPSVVHVTSVALDKHSLSMKTGGTAQLTATVAPENADDKTVTWTTSDPAVAEVDATGLVTAKSAGGAVITVTTTDGGFTDTCTVTVTAASTPEGPGTPGTPGTPGNPGTPSTPAIPSKPGTETPDQPPAPDEATPSPGDDPGTEGPTHNFTDLGGGDAWYQDAVDYVVSNGIMNGYSETTFGPDENLSRAQLAQILYNMEGLPAVTDGSGFADVSPAAWYAAAVAWAAGNGVVSGYGNGLFGPDDDITREQFVMILWRYAGSPAPTGASLGFADADAASEWAVDALRWAVEQGILNGSNGLLAPQELATRAQAAQMLWRFCEVVKQ